MSSVHLLSARRRTFEHCTSCCPSRGATMVVLTKKKKKKKKKKKTPNAAYHATKKIFWGSVPTLEARSSLKSAVWRRIEWVHQSANDKTTTWPPAAGSAWKSCFDQLGHDRSAVIIQRCAACPWISAIFPGGRHYFSPHKMAKKNHWLSWHSRFKACRTALQRAAWQQCLKLCSVVCTFNVCPEDGVLLQGCWSSGPVLHRSRNELADVDGCSGIASEKRNSARETR